jgi:hypothetical protein
VEFSPCHDCGGVGLYSSAFAFALKLLICLGIPLGLLGILAEWRTRRRSPRRWPSFIGACARLALAMQLASALFSLVIGVIVVVNWRDDPFFSYFLFAAVIGSVLFGIADVPAWRLVAQNAAAEVVPRVVP